MLDFSPVTFSCPNCRPTLSYIVADGKFMGLTTRKVSHLTEHEHAPGDDQVLKQATTYKERVFLPEGSERERVR